MRGKGYFAAIGMAVAGAAGHVAVAADAPGAGVPAPTTWTGIYAGIEGGGVFGNSNHIDRIVSGTRATTPGYDLSGGLFGDTIGYNRQYGHFVYGLEGDFSWLDAEGEHHELPPFATSTINGTKEHWLGTGRLRLGYAPINDLLLYATGGVAVGSVAATIEAANGEDLSDTHTRWGWTVGAGSEAMLAPQWSIKAEYLYVDFQSEGYFSRPPIGFNPRSDIPVDDHIFRIGIAYHFMP